MKQLITAAFVFILASCGNSQNKPLGPSEYYGAAGAVKIVSIDSCEYVTYWVYGGRSITHKGNCKFCAKRK